MATRSRLLSRIAADIDANGNLLESGISSDVTLGGATIYANRSNLPVSGNTEGDQAYVTANNRLYIWNGNGWYSVALLNVAPSISSVQDSDGNTTPFTLSDEGAVTTITITATDSDGDLITYSATADSDFAGLATLSQDENVFTITPFSVDSATTESGTITFKATDGVNIASSGVQTFTLEFVSELWDETVLSIGTSSTNSLDNSTFVDRSTNASTVTTTGTPIQTAFHPYLKNWSVEFPDGANKYLQVAASNDFNFGAGDFTIECWYYHLPKTASDADRRYLIHNEQSWGGTRWILYAGIDSQKFSFYTYSDFVANGNTPMLVSTSDLVLNQWHHLALTRSGNTFRIFINGVLEDSSTRYTGNIGADTYPTFIGGGAVQTNRMLSGIVSNARIVKGTALYTSAFTPPTEKLTAVSGTSLLTCQSNQYIDNSSSAHAITVAGDLAISASNPFGQSEYAVGENKGATYFDGSGDYLQASSSENLSGDFTIECWVWHVDNGATANPSQRIFTTTTGGNSSTNLQIIIGNSTGSGVYDGAPYVYGSDFLGSSDESITGKGWHHIAVTRGGSDVKLFVNGVQKGSTVTNSDSFSLTNSFIGTRDTGVDNDNFSGYISDLKVVNGTAIYTANFTPPTSPVGNSSASLYLPMDNAGIYDKTGNHTLTLLGDASTSTTQTKFADTAIYFDGTGDYLKVSASEQLAFGTVDFTIECWVYKNASNAYMTLGGNASTGSESNKYQLVSSADGTKIGFYMAGNFRVVSTSTIPTSTWTHVAYVRSSGVLYIYINGVQEDSAATTENLDFDEFWVGQIPALASGRDWNGYIENLQILKGVAKYTANFTVPDQEQGRTYQAED